MLKTCKLFDISICILKKCSCFLNCDIIVIFIAFYWYICMRDLAHVILKAKILLTI